MGYSLAPDTPLWNRSIEEMVKHMPPSSAELRLVDLSINSKDVIKAISKLRPDIVLQDLPNHPTALSSSETEILKSLRENLSQIKLEDDSVDAVIAHSVLYLLDDSQDFFEEVMRILRPGGRFILFDPAAGKSNWQTLKNILRNPKGGIQAFQWHQVARKHHQFLPETTANLLETAGFARILAEETLNGWAILSRGEKPHAANMSTIDRVAIGATDNDNLGLIYGDEFNLVKGRFIHLLIQQTPNIPIWKAKEGEIQWKAAALSSSNTHELPIAFAFTSLPKAVNFMQAAVLEGKIQNINKIAKFNKKTASQWDFRVLLNPTLSSIRDQYPQPTIFLPIDPESAEAPDE